MIWLAAHATPDGDALEQAVNTSAPDVQSRAEALLESADVTDRARAHWALARFDTPEAHLHACLELDTPLAPQCALDLGRLGDAAMFERAREGGLDAEVERALGDAAWAAGRPDPALEHYGRSLDLWETRPSSPARHQAFAEVAWRHRADAPTPLDLWEAIYITARRTGANDMQRSSVQERLGDRALLVFATSPTWRGREVPDWVGFVSTTRVLAAEIPKTGSVFDDLPTLPDTVWVLGEPSEPIDREVRHIDRFSDIEAPPPPPPAPRKPWALWLGALMFTSGIVFAGLTWWRRR